MSIETKKMDIEIGGIKFSCEKQLDGSWYCCGKIGEIGYGLKFPNSSPTHVFQHIEHIVSRRI